MGQMGPSRLALKVLIPLAIGVMATIVATYNDSISYIFLLCGFLYLCFIL